MKPASLSPSALPLQPALAVPEPSSSDADRPSAVLGYENPSDPIDNAIPPGPRPRWVYAIVGVYVLAVLALLLTPVVLQWTSDNGVDMLPPILTVSGGLLACEIGLLVTPVAAGRRRRVARRSLWVPIVASGLLGGLLVLGAGLALAEYAYILEQAALPALAAAALFWAVWSVVFWLLSRDADPGPWSMRLHRLLIGGSVLELLVAVPTHLLVRRREECCGGIATGLGICIGVAVMLLAFGPSVVLLYYRRWKQVTRPRSGSQPPQACRSD